MSRTRIALGALALVALAALFVVAVRRVPADALARLARARPLPIALGAALYATSFAARAVRLNLLLPPEGRIPFGRAFSVSGGATFVLQVIPFRGGELGSWALYRKALGGGWARAGAVFALVKIVDTAALFLVGLGGAAALAARRGTPAISLAAGVLVLVGAALLLVLPSAGSRLLTLLAARLSEGSRARRIANEVVLGLSVARQRPRAYIAAVAAALVFLAGHLAALSLASDGFGMRLSIPGLAFASLVSISTAALLPSPAGTFGPMEGGFAAGLTLDGVPLGLGIVLAALLHLLTTAVAGLIAIPLIIENRRVSGSGAPLGS